MNFGCLACPHQHTFQVRKSELWFGPNGFEVQSERDRDKGKLIERERERERETNCANKKQECKVYRYRLDIYNLIFAQHLDLQYIQGLLVIIFKDTHGAQQQQPLIFTSESEYLFYRNEVGDPRHQIYIYQ